MSVNKLSKGTLYFIKENDFLDKSRSNYIKIGLVRGERTTKERIADHQTGNPRELIDHLSLVSPMIDHLETFMHYEFAEYRINGEWFFMTDDQLQVTINRANQIIEEQEETYKSLEQSKKLKNQVSNDKLLNSKDEFLKIWSEMKSRKFECVVLKFQKKLIEEKIRQKLKHNGSIDGIARWNLKGGTEFFNEKQLKLDMPDIYESFLTLEEEKITGSFLFKGTKAIKKEFPSLYEEKQSMESLEIISEQINMKKVVKRDEDLETLHRDFIRLSSESNRKEWDYQKLEVKLKVIVGINAGIEDICTWNRELKSGKKFNKSEFQESHEDIYKRSIHIRPNTVALDIHMFRPYTPMI